jgi:hypothetical protein
MHSSLPFSLRRSPSSGGKRLKPARSVHRMTSGAGGGEDDDDMRALLHQQLGHWRVVERAPLLPSPLTIEADEE